MNYRKPITPRIAFWGICSIAVIWITLTLFFEMRMGFPTDTLQFAKRLVGWGVEVWFLRTLAKGVRRVGVLSLI